MVNRREFLKLIAAGISPLVASMMCNLPFAEMIPTPTSKPATNPAANPTSTSLPTVTVQSISTATLTPAPFTATTPGITVGPPSSDIDALVNAYMRGDSHVPGLAVGVIEVSGNNIPVYSMGFFGVRSKDKATKPTADTLFEIGSETKVFTATLLAFMVNNGQIKLNDPIQAYLPAGVHAPTYQSQPIRVVDLATHRSGLPDTPANRPQECLKPYTVQDMYDWLNSYKLTRPPGSQWEYSNISFGLLGTILARTAGTSYDQLITRYLGKPLNMPDTTQFPSPEQLTCLAVGYDEKGNPAIPFYQCEGGVAVREKNGVAGGGQLYSTLTDMTRFAAANLDLIGDETVTKAFDLTQQVSANGGKPGDKMGLGWQMGPERIMWKDGLTDGFHSYIALFKGKDVKYAVFLLGNGRTKDGLEPLGGSIIKHLIGVNH